MGTINAASVWGALSGLLAMPAIAAGEPATQSLEDLLATEVVGASKGRQLIAEAPANVTVISAEEIRRYGYRTLADALVRVPGVLVGQATGGSTLALRGSSANQRQDWGSRILLMVDGHRVNDGMYDQALFGDDSLVDIEAVERIEFIKGPGSTLYGGNALYGVVNVITRRGRAAEGAELWSQARQGTTSVGATLGGASAGGVEWRLSAARRANPTLTSRVDGRPLSGGGSYDDLASYADKTEQVSLTLDAGQYRLVALASRWRTDLVGLMTMGADGEAYPYQANGDNSQYLLGASGRWVLGGQTELAAQLSLGQSRRAYVDGGEDTGHVPWQMDWRAASSWSGGELRLASEAFERQRVSAGVEWRRDFWRDYADHYWENGVELTDWAWASRSSRDSVGVYLQDEIVLAERWALTVGGRLDKVTGYGNEFSPRLALVWAPGAATTVKLIHAEAFRPPNSLEYDPTLKEDGQLLPLARPGLERVKSNELSFEYRQGAFAGSAALFANRNQGMISYLGGAEAINQPEIRTHGVELSASWRALSGFGGYANLAWQKSRDAAGEGTSGTPEWVASAGVDAASADGRYLAALEWQAVSAVELFGHQERAPGFGVVNVRLAARPWHKALEWSLQVQNLTGRDYLQVAQGTLAASRGRAAWLGVRYTP